jgi:hypothetical protein
MDRRMRNLHNAIARRCATAMLGCLALATAAHAEDPMKRGFFLAVYGGQSKLYNSRHLDSASKIIVSSAGREWTDQSSDTRSATVGYWINRHFAVEASYWDFGDGTFNEYRETNSSFFNERIQERFIDIKTAAKGYSGGVIVSYPWKNWRVSAKISGLKHEVTQSGNGLRTTTLRLPPGQPPVTSSLVMSDSFGNTTAMYGAAISYTWAGHFVVEADWRLAKHLGEQVHFDGLNVSVLGVGLQYRF